MSGIVRRHHGDEGLAQPRGRLRTEIGHLPCSRPVSGSRTIASRYYGVKNNYTAGRTS